MWTRFYENSRLRHWCYYANRKYCFICLFMYETQDSIASQGHISSLCSQVFWNPAEYYRTKSATDVLAIQICCYGIDYTMLMLKPSLQGLHHQNVTFVTSANLLLGTPHPSSIILYAIILMRNSPTAIYYWTKQTELWKTDQGILISRAPASAEKKNNGKKILPMKQIVPFALSGPGKNLLMTLTTKKNQYRTTTIPIRNIQSWIYTLFKT